MIERIAAAQRHFRDFGWLKTHWLFSFDDYYDPRNISFSSLRVFNDDIIGPHAGFPLHGHKEMEIVTVMLAGELTHEDSLGNRATIRAGDIQRMTAGRGIRHSEFNHSDAPVHLYQLWIEPRMKGLEPTFEEFNFAERGGATPFEPLVSGRAGVAAPLTINADATVYRFALSAGGQIAQRVEDRSIFLYVTKGGFTVNGISVEAGDQLRVVAERELVFEACSEAHGILVDLP